MGSNQGKKKKCTTRKLRINKTQLLLENIATGTRVCFFSPVKNGVNGVKGRQQKRKDRRMESEGEIERERERD